MDSKGITDTIDQPTKVHWFEFLLDDTLLERHLAKESPDPRAGDLISLFLYQADIAANTAREITAKENASQAENPQLISDITGADSMETKKVRVLRHLALRVACHLKWNLVLLENSVPLAMVQSLLLEFLKVTSPEEDLTLKHPKSLDMGSLAPQALFALLLYHRWCLRTAVQETFPTRPSKTVNVQVPGILDPSVTSTNMKDAVLQSVGEGLEDSVIILETYVAQNRDVSLPLPASIGAVVFGDMVGHDWTLVANVSGREMLAQVNFDLGSHYFCQQVYPRALSAFADTDSILRQLKQVVFCTVDEVQLQGYLSACRGVVTSVQDASTPHYHRSSLEKMEECCKIGFEGAVELLWEDNKTRQLSLSYRNCIQNSVYNKHRQSFGDVVVLNAVRRTIEGHMTHPNLLTCLQADPVLIKRFIQAIEDVMQQTSWQEKTNLKVLVRFVYKHLKGLNISQKMDIPSTQLQQLFSSPDDLSSLTMTPSEEQEDCQSHLEAYLPSTGGTMVELGKAVSALLASYDPAQIKSLVQQIHPKLGKLQTMFLSDRWQISRELQKGIENLPVPNPTIQVYAHILLAKVRLCLNLKQYETAQLLLTAADSAVHDVAYKLSKLIRQEMLYVDLAEHQTVDVGADVDQDMVKRVKSCLTSPQLEHAESGLEISILCCAFLLNAKDWEFLPTVPSRNNGYIEMSRLLASLCKELPLLKNARLPGRDFWEAVVHIFTSPAQQKRGTSGSSRDIQHEPVQGILTSFNFSNFIVRIRDPLMLSALISCLTKLVNIVKDDSAVEILSDFLHLWPATATSQMNCASVLECTEALMTHALSVNPSCPSWLRTRGDFHFSQGHYMEALQAYITLGLVATDYFTDTITKNVYDDAVYKRMIKCCNYLNCHTQVAVLCQCLDDVDHSQAFKALQEKLTHDAMDTYYPFFWDITILEFLIYLHGKRAELDKKQFVMKLIGQLELNNSNPAEILQEAARIRKAQFFQTLAAQYL